MQLPSANISPSIITNQTPPNPKIKTSTSSVVTQVGTFFKISSFVPGSPDRLISLSLVLSVGFLVIVERLHRKGANLTWGAKRSIHFRNWLPTEQTFKKKKGKAHLLKKRHIYELTMQFHLRVRLKKHLSMTIYILHCKMLGIKRA